MDFVPDARPPSRPCSTRTLGLRGRLGALSRDAAFDCDEYDGGGAGRPTRSGASTRAARRRRPPGCSTSSRTPIWSSTGATRVRRRRATCVSSTSRRSGVRRRRCRRGDRPPPVCANRSARLYPAPAYLRMCVAAGLPVAFSRDAHTPMTSATAYGDRAVADCGNGVGEIAVFTRARSATLEPIG